MNKVLDKYLMRLYVSCLIPNLALKGNPEVNLVLFLKTVKLNMNYKNRI